MKTLGTRKARRLLFLALSVMLLTCFSCVSALAATRVNVEEGTYYIKAVNGNAKGKVLYWDEKASDQNTCMMFESCGGSHADNEVWFITKNRNFDDYYGIYLARSYTGNKDKSKRIEIDNLTGRDEPTIVSTVGPHVFCGAFSNQDDGFYFVCEKGDNYSTNLTIRSHDENYTFNRHKDIKIFHHDLIYVNANKDKDTNNKLWELVPVNYEKKMSGNSLSLTAQNSNCVAVTSWSKGEGKSTATVNLSISFAKMGKRVLLIDTDLRRPNLHNLLKLKNDTGVSDVIGQFGDFETAVHRNAVANLDVLTSGAIPPNPSELLASPVFTELLEKVKQEYDYVILDTPPLGVVTDTLLLKDFVGGYVLVVRERVTSHGDIERALQSVKLADTKVLGFLKVGCEMRSRGYGYNKYRYRYNYNYNYYYKY